MNGKRKMNRIPTPVYNTYGRWYLTRDKTQAQGVCYAAVVGVSGIDVGVCVALNRRKPHSVVIVHCV